MGALQLEQRATAASTTGGGKLLVPTVAANDKDGGRRSEEESYGWVSATATVPAADHPTSDSVHQIGTRYSSNNAGDGPEKTRDRKSWFPRFKSNWLGTFRSKQMFQCCECAVVAPANGSSLSSQAGRYKGAEGKHCRCGKDQWHLAKSVEETEYNRRMEISKALGGMRYDEAVLRLRSMGQSELDFKPSEHIMDTGSPTQPRSTRGFAPSSSALSSASSSSQPKRARSVSSGPLLTPASREFAAPVLMKPELSTLPAQVFGYDNPAKQYGAYAPVYGNNGIEYSQTVQPQHPVEYEQLAPQAFGDEENFGELLQGILEDDPRVAASANMGLGPNQANAYAGGRYGYYAGGAAVNGSVAPLKRTMSMPSYAMTPSSMLASPPSEPVEQEYYADPTRRASLNLGVNQAPSYVTYHAPQQQQQQPVMQQFPYQQQQQQLPQQQVYSRPLSMTANMETATSSSFST
jgi:hypothetical protein